MSEVLGKAKASTTKAFFVRMITRDITLEDSILDLIDNSVDAAWKNEGSRPTGLAESVDLSKYKISIIANKNKFVISDNCGGMSLADAADYAFSFGRRDDSPTDKYSIGVYGIGMKRAVFKLGEKISIKSTTIGEKNKKMGFEVPINVSEWLKKNDEPWDFDLVESDADSERGVVISASQLTSATKNAFGNPTFFQQLHRTIARDYSLHLNRGLTIEVNGKNVEGWNIVFKSGGEFKPARFDYVDKIDGKPVKVEIIGGMADAPPDSNEPSEKEKSQNPYGWYVICNGRVVLAADKTEVSGWGSPKWPKWHPQYAGFVGLIVFSARDALDLPLTTTKRSVDRASGAFRRAKPRIREISRAWVDYTNRRKSMNAGSSENKKEVIKLEAAAKPVSVYQVKKQKVLRFPEFGQKGGKRPAHIAYSVPEIKVRALARGFGDVNLSNREVGLKSFEHAYEELAEEN